VCAKLQALISLPSQTGRQFFKQYSLHQSTVYLKNPAHSFRGAGELHLDYTLVLENRQTIKNSYAFPN